MNEHAVFKPELERLRKRTLFDILAEFNKFVDACGFWNALDVLANNWTLVEVFGGKVRCSTDNLYTLVPCLVVRLCSLECREKSVVDVDDTVLEFFGKVLAQDLHVTGEDDGVCVRFLNDFAEAVFGNGLVWVGRHVVERHTKGAAYRAQVRVVSDDAAEFAGEVAIAMFEKKIIKAVVGLRDENGNAFGLRGIEKFPIKLEMRSDGLEMSFDFGNVVRFNVENGTQEKRFDIFGGVLLEVDNISSGFGENLRCAGNKSFLVRTKNLKNITSHRHTIILKNLGHFTKQFTFK